MKKLVFSFLFSFITLYVVSQIAPDKAVQSVQFSDVNGRLISAGSNGVQGSPYIFEQFGIGKVIMYNGMIALDSNLNFSLFDHKLYFTNSKGLYLVNLPVKSFQLNQFDKEKNLVTKYFASAYPHVENNTTATFYEIIANGDIFQLLKYSNKRIKESTFYGGPPIKEYVVDDLFYIYVQPEKNIIFLGSLLNLKSIKKALPNLADKLDMIVVQNKLNIRKEGDMIKLIEKLN